MKNANCKIGKDDRHFFNVEVAMESIATGDWRLVDQERVNRLRQEYGGKKMDPE